MSDIKLTSLSSNMDGTESSPRMASPFSSPWFEGTMSDPLQDSLDDGESVQMAFFDPSKIQSLAQSIANQAVSGGGGGGGGTSGGGGASEGPKGGATFEDHKKLPASVAHPSG